MLYNTNKNYGFTLLELIVVITILAILWTIAFMSLQWYSKAARDSARISDISRIKTSLELYQIEAGKYPDPSSITDMTYSGTIAAWHQGTFWEQTFRNVEKLDRIPVDPVTDSEYTYSVTNSRKEYQIGWILESDDFALSTTNTTSAWDTLAKAKVAWSYNWSVLKVIKWNKIYLLSVPSIICADWFSLEECLNQNKLVFNWYRNLPPSYKTTKYKSLWEGSSLNLVNSWADILVYSWDGSELNADTTEAKAVRKAMVEKLQLAYKDTEIAHRDWIRQLVNVDITDDEATENAWISFINTKINSAMITWKKLSVQSSTTVSSSDSSTSWAPVLETSDSGIEWYKYPDWTFASSCLEYKYPKSNYVASDIDWYYFIQPDENPAFIVYCDMTTDNWWWTKMKISHWTNNDHYLWITYDDNWDCDGDWIDNNSKTNTRTILAASKINYIDNTKVCAWDWEFVKNAWGMSNNTEYTLNYSSSWATLSSTQLQSLKTIVSELHPSTQIVNLYWDAYKTSTDRYLEYHNWSSWISYRTENLRTFWDDTTTDEQVDVLVVWWDNCDVNCFLPEKLRQKWWWGDIWGWILHTYQERYFLVRWTDFTYLDSKASCTEHNNAWYSLSGRYLIEWVDTYCNMTNPEWQVQTTGSSCLDILTNNPSATDWVYTIDPSVDWTSFDVYCDMTTDWGGWTLVWENNNWWLHTSSAVWTNPLSSSTQWHWKLSDSIINSIKSSTLSTENWYRINYDDFVNKYFWAADCVFNASIVASWSCTDWSVDVNNVWTYAWWGDFWYWLERRKSGWWNNGWSMSGSDYIYPCYNSAYSNNECSQWYNSSISSNTSNPWTNLWVR